MGSPPPGTLYVVGTPIGHLEDITLRALSVLGAVDLIAAEDTRTTGRMLARHGIATPRTSYHEHNETRRTPELLQRLKGGASIALVSNAGTPGISDPGYRLVAAAAEAGLRVVPIPGPSAAAAALSVSGLPTDAFLFLGFLSKKAGKRRSQIDALASDGRTVILYESPRRIRPLIAELRAVLGDRRAVLAREMTKVFEEFLRGRLSAIEAALADRDEIKGECTLILAGPEDPCLEPREELPQAIRRALAAGGGSLSELARELARRYGLPRQTVYAEAMRIKTEREPTTD
ncbi:MAG: 16S rRNA (cytidine(1402)-2'-O)-methyltransferase [Desulfobacterales bacterium]|nr:16S rRNA (cytidine(1402)-2'-O)-methyltransferase [Desulfobacterales bacterium]MCU0585237.1 16S rRNA (cytidine(1402)-2'-O)-methyltransferase [Desulfobacterales bacterium]